MCGGTCTDTRPPVHESREDQQFAWSEGQAARGQALGDLRWAVVDQALVGALPLLTERFCCSRTGSGGFAAFRAQVEERWAPPAGTSFGSPSRHRPTVAVLCTASLHTSLSTKGLLVKAVMRVDEKLRYLPLERDGRNRHGHD